MKTTFLSIGTVTKINKCYPIQTEQINSGSVVVKKVLISINSKDHQFVSFELEREEVKLLVRNLQRNLLRRKSIDRVRFLGED